MNSPHGHLEELGPRVESVHVPIPMPLYACLMGLWLVVLSRPALLSKSFISFLVLFACSMLSDLLHMYAHAITARRLGYHPVDFTVLSFTSLHRVPSLNKQTRKAAILPILVAGPLCTFALAVAPALGLLARKGSDFSLITYSQPTLSLDYLLFCIAYVNTCKLFFISLPIPGFDGWMIVKRALGISPLRIASFTGFVGAVVALGGITKIVLDQLFASRFPLHWLDALGLFFLGSAIWLASQCPPEAEAELSQDVIL